ncbi:MAG TPA: quinone-dependent dihydroorotate dehydrogenase [Aliiroseovarius sp.]|nr:quinone-dependent dihydroorotate dehydrogenase [Aliiroseovarius sp.]
MTLVERIGLAALHRLDPERAHAASVIALRAGLAPLPGPVNSARLQTEICGLPMPNPVGLAAGFDKDCVATDELSRAGFGFVECGAVTPRAQPGNPKPRLFRLAQDGAVINRFGFNNAGMDAAAARLSARRVCDVPVGLNLGANKDSTDRAGDYARVLAACGAHVDFATINVSSPNTEGLRDLQGAEALAALIDRVAAVRDSLARRIPLFVKIAPDLSDPELVEMAAILVQSKADAVIATNTTLDRTGLKSASKGEAGGLSGAPLFEKSTRVLARLSQLTDAKLPLIGVGGVGSAAQAYAKIRAGASAVQLYTALVYGGLSLAGEIAQGLDDLLARDGFASVAEAVGTGREDYL